MTSPPIQNCLLILEIKIIGSRLVYSGYCIHAEFKMGLFPSVARSLVQLFEDGCEVPFIARYRRYLIGEATPDDLRHAVETFKHAKHVFISVSSV